MGKINGDSLIHLIAHVPDSARHAPGGRFRKREMVIRNHWPIGKFVRCRSNGMFKSRGAPANEQRVSEIRLT